MPADIHDIPPEILAVAFEIGILTWGIGFISPLPRVCQNWHFIIDTTPRLWGIISVAPRSSASALEKQIMQIVKAKASPLSIQISASATRGLRRSGVQEQLFSLSHNWVSLDVETAFLYQSGTRWSNLRYNLETLNLHRGSLTYDDPGSFFEDSISNSHFHRQETLHTFFADSLANAWTVGFLGPWIKHFHLRHSQKITDTWDFLSRIPRAITIELCQVQHVDHPDSVPPLPRLIVLSKLWSLRLKSVKLAPAVLSAIAAPSLQILSIHEVPQRLQWGEVPSTRSMSGFFAQWSQPSHTPTHLNTLELIDSLGSGDTPYFIRWLRRLPNLVRLLITDEEIGKAATSTPTDSNEEVNLYNALAYPWKEDGGSSSSFAWLCPSLMILYLDTGPELTDLIPIARSRGGIVPPITDIPPPGRLRRLESHLCPVHNQDELDELKSLIDEANCICTQCGLTIEDDSR